jgi:hypothetical protein
VFFLNSSWTFLHIESSSIQYSVVPDGYGASPEEVQKAYALSQVGVIPSGSAASPSSKVIPGKIEYKGPGMLTKRLSS